MALRLTVHPAIVRPPTAARVALQLTAVIAADPAVDLATAVARAMAAHAVDTAPLLVALRAIVAAVIHPVVIRTAAAEATPAVVEEVDTLAVVVAIRAVAEAVTPGAITRSATVPI